MGGSDSKYGGDSSVELCKMAGVPRSLQAVIASPKTIKEMEYLGETITNIRIYRDQAFPHKHKYLVLQTASAWWSLEKNNQGVALQFGLQPEDVADRFNKKGRKGGKTLKREATASITVEQLFKFIDKQDVWAYDRKTANSEHFAQLVFDHVAVRIYYDTRHVR